MRISKPFAWAALSLVALGLFAAPSAQAGTRVSVNIGGYGGYGGGYCAPAYYPRPYYGYYPQPYYQPVVYRPAYYAPPRAYYPAPGYRPYGYGYGRPAYNPYYR